MLHTTRSTWSADASSPIGVLVIAACAELGIQPFDLATKWARCKRFRPQLARVVRYVLARGVGHAELGEWFPHRRPVDDPAGWVARLASETERGPAKEAVKDRADLAFRAVCERLNIDADWFRSARVGRCHLRAAVYDGIRELEPTIALQSIARAMGYHHSTLLHLIDKRQPEPVV